MVRRAAALSLLVASAALGAEAETPSSAFEGAALLGYVLLSGPAPEISFRGGWRVHEHLTLSLRVMGEVGIPGAHEPDSSRAPASIVEGHQAWALLPEARLHSESLFVDVGGGVGQLVSGQCCFENPVLHGHVGPAGHVSIGGAFGSFDGWRFELALGFRFYAFVPDSRRSEVWHVALLDTVLGVFATMGVVFPLPFR